MLESIEDMRNTVQTIAADCDEGWILGCLDAVEAEIERDYMKLPEGWTAEQAGEIIGYWPKWDDGKPCMFGDRFTTPKYAFEENAETFDRLVIYARDHVFKHADGTTYEGEHGGYYEWNYFRPGGDGCEEYRPHHYVPQRTIEDVLRELIADVRMEGIARSKLSDETIAKYADELRELMEVGE